MPRPVGERNEYFSIPFFSSCNHPCFRELCRCERGGWTESRTFSGGAQCGAHRVVNQEEEELSLSPTTTLWVVHVYIHFDAIKGHDLFLFSTMGKEKREIFSVDNNTVSHLLHLECEFNGWRHFLSKFFFFVFFVCVCRVISCRLSTWGGNRFRLACIFFSSGERETPRISNRVSFTKPCPQV